jgi:periplasmic protein TonB
LFSETQPEGRKRWDLSLLVSYAAHVAVLLAIGYRVAPVFVMPSEVALGTPGSSGTVTYLAPTGSERAQPPREKPELTMNPADAKLPVPPKPLPPAEQKSDAASDASIDKTTNGGSPYGSRIPGAPLTGHEIIPALPQVFPDPAVSRADLPAGVEGDVVVEVTIDEQGNVVGLKLIRGIGYGIEDRVLATLRQWRFRPASKDGVAIASQHIVTIHYPG